MFDNSHGLDFEAVTRLVCKLPDVEKLFEDDVREFKNSSYPLEILGSKIGTKFALLRQVSLYSMPFFVN